MEPYKANYQNWKSIIPSFSYKNYDGYVYSSATGIAGNLDNASAIAVDHGLTEANRTSDISSTVSAWATRINNGASYLSSAKTAASSATKITTKYNDLIAAVSAAEDVYKNYQNKYTVASRNAFKTAYEAAKTHMASLAPTATMLSIYQTVLLLSILPLLLHRHRHHLNTLRLHLWLMTVL